VSTRHCLILLDGPSARQGGVDGPFVARWRKTGASFVGVSVFYDDDPKYAKEPTTVYVSAASLHEHTWQLTPQIGFCNVQEHCDQLREKGFPVVEAQLAWDADRRDLSVRIPYFVQGTASIQCDAEPLIEVRVPGASATDHPESRPAPVRFSLQILAPDPVQCASLLLPEVSTQDYAEIIEQVSAQDASVRIAPCRFPDLSALMPAQVMKQVWLGVGEMAPSPREAGPPPPPPVPTPIEDESPFGPSRMMFNEVELIGFRIGLPGLKRGDLQALVAPLNNALVAAAAPTGITDYKYEPASATLVIELLRYGRMRCEMPRLPLTSKDYICQHELIVRLMVGRVDDDTAQAREPASFVPALFVDEAWSKMLGRELEGYPKELVRFQTGDGRSLRSDGRLERDAVPTPLTDVARVVTEETIGVPGKAPFFSVDYPDVSFNDKFQAVDLATLSGISWPGLGRWRQSDFEEGEFRRSFARAVMRPGFDEFQTIQVCPIDKRQRSTSPALVRGRFSFSKLKTQFPEGIAEVTLNAAHAPQTTLSGSAWKTLIGILGGKDAPSVTLTCVTGEWYRVRSDCRLTIEEAI
jgi:hypothetical protein